MTRIVGVRFRNAGKVYYFDPKDLEIRRGSHVIVETARGVEYGTVVAHMQEVPDEKVVQPLKAVIRIANAEDDARAARNREKEKEAMRICREKIRKHNLEMKLIDAEYTFDNNKVLFYFTADGRIDFRDLVKDLAAVFKTRIELRQIGVRDETKLLGGVGICGRPLCCHTFLSDFAPVSIRMAKEQNLSLNPTKISGVCGRLMCCLKNEQETYEYLNSRLPGNGDMVLTDDGLKGQVQNVNVLRQTVKVVIDVNDEKEIREYRAEQLKFKPRKRRGGQVGVGTPLNAEELALLEEAAAEERAERAERQKKGDRQNRAEKGGRGERPKKEGRGDRPERAERQDRPEGERPKRNDRPRRERQERGERPEGAERQRQRQDRPERQDRPRRPRRQEGRPTEAQPQAQAPSGGEAPAQPHED